MSADEAGTRAPDVSWATSGEILALVAGARQVPSADRERLASAWRAWARGGDTVLLRTCHRVELYATATAGLPEGTPELPPGVQRLADAAAARHLISVTCGLDSAVLGENQILHQVRQTYTSHSTAHQLDPRLDRLFQTALRAGRRARWGVVGNTQRSLGDVAVARLERRIGPLAGRGVLVVGAGTMGRLAAVAAGRRQGRVLITNRTSPRATALADRIGATAVSWPAFGLPGVVAVIVALAGPWNLDQGEAARLRRRGVVVVDLSAPLAVDAPARQVLGEHFISIDDLAWAGTEVAAEDRVEQVEELVDEAGRSYGRWLASRANRPMLRQLSMAAESRRRRELEWLQRRLPQLSDRERALVDQMSHRLVAGILHAPRAALGSGDDDLAPVARRLFGL